MFTKKERLVRQSEYPDSDPCILLRLNESERCRFLAGSSDCVGLSGRQCEGDRGCRGIHRDMKVSLKVLHCFLQIFGISSRVWEEEYCLVGQSELNSLLVERGTDRLEQLVSPGNIRGDCLQTKGVCSHLTVRIVNFWMILECWACQHSSENTG